MCLITGQVGIISAGGADLISGVAARGDEEHSPGWTVPLVSHTFTDSMTIETVSILLT